MRNFFWREYFGALSLQKINILVDEYTCLLRTIFAHDNFFVAHESHESTRSVPNELNGDLYGRTNLTNSRSAPQQDAFVIAFV